ncbi:hypothetical protein [Odoribacter lunatus]|uniref:hypothetical protein n=1 Tax=Odoribacter lunatus TaxID=2941335 RepID=UPI0020415703|nr:hypothetical protein [Odoribacter lunatus]
MKTMNRVLISVVLVVLAFTASNAQSSAKALKKDLKAKVEKDCRKTAKQLEKEGWKVMPGKLPLERQIQDSRYAELDTDNNGEKLYLTATHKSVGGNYSAAKKIADDRAASELAEHISKTISEMIKGKLSSTDYGDGDIETIDEFISANKNLVSVSLESVFPVLEIYREKDNKVEVQVMVKTNAAKALKVAKKAYKDKLYQQSAELAKDLDELLPY